MSGEEAARIGLVSDVVSQNEDGSAAFERSLELARKIAANVILHPTSAMMMSHHVLSQLDLLSVVITMCMYVMILS